MQYYIVVELAGSQFHKVFYLGLLNPCYRTGNISDEILPLSYVTLHYVNFCSEAKLSFTIANLRRRLGGMSFENRIHHVRESCAIVELNKIGLQLDCVLLCLALCTYNFFLINSNKFKTI